MAMNTDHQDNIPASLQVRKSTTGTLVIPARVGHRRTLRDIFVRATTPRILELKIGNVTLLRVPTNNQLSGFIFEADNRYHDMGGLSVLSQIIPNLPKFTAAEDEDITITVTPTPIMIWAYYEDTVEGDVKNKDIDGGSQGKRHLYVMRMTHSMPLTATGKYSLDLIDMPTGLSFLTDTKTVAPNQRFHLWILGQTSADHAAGEVRVLHLFENNVEMFTSETNQGISVRTSDFTAELTFHLAAPWYFKVPNGHTFHPNTRIEANVEFTYAGAGSYPAQYFSIYLIGVREFITEGT